MAHHISLTAAARADIAWSVEFLPSWNGRAFFPSPRRHSGLLPTRMGWAPAFRAYHINVLELFAVAIAVHCWGEEWHDTQILLHTDGMPVQQVWTTGTCKCPHMSLVRRLFFFPCPAEREFASGARAVRILSLICFLGCRWRSSGPEHVGHCPRRRWFRLTFGSGFNTTTSTAGKLRGCQHVTGLRVRAESVPDFVGRWGSPTRSPFKSSCWSCWWPSGVRAFPWPPSARPWQGCSISASVSTSRWRWRVCILSGLCCAASNASRPTASHGRLGDLSQLPP